MPDHYIIQTNTSLREHNTFGIAAKAHRYASIESVAMLQSIIRSAEFAELPRLILGGGSNIILSGDFSGLVLHMNIRGISVVGADERATYVKAGAGENWHQFVQWTLDRQLGGLENLSLIPGSVGAAPVQNIGAYGAEIRDCLHKLTALDLVSGEIVELNNAECGFAYRDSVFKGRLKNRAVILDVTFALPRQWQANLRYAELAQALDARGCGAPTAREVSDAVIAIRTRKLPDPAVIGNAGSFFKNPIVTAAKRQQLLAEFPQLISYPQADGSYKLAAGWLIDQCGWKGKRLGPAGVYERQALVLVNLGGARGADIMALAKAIQADVTARFGVALEIEPVVV